MQLASALASVLYALAIDHTATDSRQSARHLALQRFPPAVLSRIVSSIQSIAASL